MKIKDVCLGITDGSHNPPQGVENSNYLMLSSKNIFDDEITFDSPRYLTQIDFEQENKRSKVKSGDVLLTIVGTVGRVAVVDEKMPQFTLQRSVAVLHPNKDICSSRYLMYALRGKRMYIESRAKGVAQKGIYLKEVADIELQVPEISEQNAIVEVLDKSALIMKFYQQQLQKLDELVKARFVELFGMPGTDAFGWGLVPLGSTCNINPKKSLDSRLVSGAVVSFVPMPAVTEHGEIDATAIKEYDEVKTGFTYFAENDVLFAKITPCMENGKGAVAKGLHNGIGFGSTEFHVLRPISGKTDPYWIYTLTAFSQFRMDAASNMTGSAGQRRVPASFLENYRVSLPPIALQEQFAAFVEQTDKSKVAVQKALDEAQLLFDSLMQKYFG
mgnify:CR=1 FL=1